MTPVGLRITPRHATPAWLVISVDLGVEIVSVGPFDQDEITAAIDCFGLLYRRERGTRPTPSPILSRDGARVIGCRVELEDPDAMWRLFLDVHPAAMIAIDVTTYRKLAERLAPKG